MAENVITWHLGQFLRHFTQNIPQYRFSLLFFSQWITEIETTKPRKGSAQTMKKFLTLILGVVLTMSLVACGDDPAVTKPDP
ncbi:MAG: hypothetical protein RSC51_08550, partial [Oscillospiraceae bacterium]